MQTITKRKIRSVFLANLLLAGVNFHVEAVTVRGARQCGNWVNSSNRVDSTEKFAQEAWLAGYLSGMAVWTGIDVLKQNELPSLSLWIENYCKNNPLDYSDDAASKLFLELKKRAGS